MTGPILLVCLVFTALGAVLGWQAHGIKADAAEYQRGEQHDREVDARHGLIR